MAVLADLKTSTLFNGCDDILLLELAEASQKLSLSPGESLFYEGDISKSLYLIKDGTVVIKKSNSNEEEKVAQLASPSHFGEVTFLSQDASGQYERRSASAEAQEHCTLVEIGFDALQVLIKKSPAFGLRLYRNMALQLSHHIRRVDDDLSSLRTLRLRHL